MDRLTIAIISDWFAPRIGGIELHVQDLARELSALGHDVRVLTTTPGPPVVDGIAVHRFDVPMWDRFGVAEPNLLRIPVAVRAIRAVQPDIVHAHGMFSVGAIAGVIAARYLRIPSIFTLHSLVQGAPIVGARAIFALFAYRADLVTAVSHAAAADARRASGRQEVVVLPNGIHPAAWVQRRTEPPGFHIVSVMRLAPVKSPGALITALARLAERVGPAIPVRLTIVGDGPERDELERRAQDLGVSDRVTFAGALARERVRDVLASASVFALPGRAEAFGIAVLEARCAGLPVVAMLGGGIPEIVEHGRHGLLARTEDEFVEHLARLAEDTSLRTRLAASARDDVERFAWGRIAGEHLATYRQVIEKHRRNGHGGRFL